MMLLDPPDSAWSGSKVVAARQCPIFMAGSTGLEPATSVSTIVRSARRATSRSDKLRRNHAILSRRAGPLRVRLEAVPAQIPHIAGRRLAVWNPRALGCHKLETVGDVRGLETVGQE